MRSKLKHCRQLLSICSAIILTACGGGGGSNATSTPAPIVATSIINTGNQNAVATQGYTALLTLNGSASSVNSVVGVNVSTSSGAGLLNTVFTLTEKALATPAPSLLAGVTNTQTESCGTSANSGSITIMATQSVTGTTSNGDSLSLTATNCVLNGTTINGGFSITFSNITGNPLSASASWSATLATTFSNLSVQSGSGNATTTGDMTIVAKQTAISQITYGVSGNSLSTSSGGTTIQMSQYAFTGSQNGTSFTYSANFGETVTSSTLNNIAFTFTTTTPFVFVTGSNPTAGSFTIKATDGTSLIATATSAGLQLQLDATGAGTYTATNLIPWSSL